MNIIANLIKKSSLLLLAAGFSIAMSSCEGDEGAVGPIGPKGDTGATGAAGEKGEPGTGMKKAGYFDGIIKGTRRDGTAFEESFKYEYTNETYQSMYNPARTAVSGINILRFRDAQPFENSPGLRITGYMGDDGSGNETFIAQDFYFIFGKELGTTQYFEFTASIDYIFGRTQGSTNATLDVTNYAYDETTGALSFTYTYNDSYGASNTTMQPVEITGTFNSGDSKFFYTEIVNRKGN